MSQDKPRPPGKIFAELVERIKALDETKFEEINLRSHTDKPNTAGFVEHFHESWKDGGRFSEGFGKSPA